MIRSLPTKMETVKEVLVQFKEKVTQLGLSETDLVLDHAIYCKAVEIIMNDRHRSERLHQLENGWFSCYMCLS